MKIYERLQKSLLGCMQVLALSILLSTTARAYTVVTISTSAPAGLERTFIANTTNQFLSVLSANPLASNTYAIKLFSANPAANGFPTTLEQALALGSTVYVYGFAAGMNYQNHVAINITSAFEQLCANATNFNLIQSSPTTFDLGTCEDVISNVIDDFYQIDLSTPTPLPVEP